MNVFKSILYSLILIVSGIIILLPFFSATLAGKCVYLTFLAWPMFILCFVLWINNRKNLGWRYVFAVITLCHLLWVWNYVPLHTGNLSGKQGTTYTIASWNVSNFGSGFQNYTVLPHAAEVLTKTHPDIICVQERPHTNVMHWDSIQAYFSDYPYIVKNKREDEVLNLAVFSKYPLGELKEYYFEGSYNKMMQVDVRLGERTIRLFNVHLQTTGLSDGKAGEMKIMLSSFMDYAILRNQQADTLYQAVQDSPHPVLITGDFNDLRFSYAYRQFYKLRDFHHVAGSGIGGTFKKFFKIDYLLCSQDLQPLDYQLGENEWSDHKMQVGVIGLK